MVVLDPLKLTITNYPEAIQMKWFFQKTIQKDPQSGEREMPFWQRNFY